MDKLLKDAVEYLGYGWTIVVCLVILVAIILGALELLWLCLAAGSRKSSD